MTQLDFESQSPKQYYLHSDFKCREKSMSKPVINDQIAGQLLGNPAAENSAEMYAWAKTLWTDDEVKELSQHPGVKSTAEVLKRLADL
jgi:hypothetical protein